LSSRGLKEGVGVGVGLKLSVMLGVIVGVAVDVTVGVGVVVSSGVRLTVILGVILGVNVIVGVTVVVMVTLGVTVGVVVGVGVGVARQPQSPLTNTAPHSGGTVSDPGFKICPVNVIDPFGQVVVKAPGLHLEGPVPIGNDGLQRIVNETLPSAAPPYKNLVELYEHEMGSNVYLAPGAKSGHALISSKPSPSHDPQGVLAQFGVGVGVVVGVGVGVGVAQIPSQHNCSSGKYTQLLGILDFTGLPSSSQEST